MGFIHPFKLIDGDQDHDPGDKDDDEYSIIWPTTTFDETDPVATSDSLSLCDDPQYKTNWDCPLWTWGSFETAKPSVTETLTRGINTAATTCTPAPSQLTNKGKPLPSGIDNNTNSNNTSESLPVTTVSFSPTLASTSGSPTSPSKMSAPTAVRSSSMGPSLSQTSGSAVVKPNSMSTLLIALLLLMVLLTLPASAHDTTDATYASKAITQQTTPKLGGWGINESNSAWFGEQLHGIVADVYGMMENFTARARDLDSRGRSQKDAENLATVMS